MEKCVTKNCQNKVDTAGMYCEECRTFVIRGWYAPSGKTQLGNKCVVEGCNRDAAFHLCKHHAIPGVVTEVQDKTFVIGLWLVERVGKFRIITLNDYALGDLFGGQQGFEDRLGVQGYKVHGPISNEKELEATKQQYPGLRVMLWSPNLPDDEDSAEEQATKA
jgi:hypothetical protein